MRYRWPSTRLASSEAEEACLSEALAPVVSENTNGGESSNPGGVLEIRGDQPTRHWTCDRRSRAELSSRPSVPSNLPYAASQW